MLSYVEKWRASPGASPGASPLKLFTFHRKESFDVKAEYVDENLPLPLTFKELGVYRIDVPPQTQAKKIKVRAKLTLHGTFVIEDTQTVEDEEYEETVKVKREPPAEAKSLIASFSTMLNEPETPDLRDT